MFNAFITDKSGFKNIIVLVTLLSFVFLAGTFMLLGQYNGIVVDNNKKEAEFQAQAVWLKKYDGNVVNEIEKKILRPCKETDVDKVQKEQLQLFEKNGVKVISVRKSAMAKNTKNPNALKGAKMTVDFEGSWENIVNMLNVFEKQKNLVVITDLTFNVKDGVHGKLDYVVYYK